MKPTAEECDWQCIAWTNHDQRSPDGVENPLWEVARIMPTRPNPWTGAPEIERRIPADHLFARTGIDREALCGVYAWAIPTPGDLAWIVKHLNGQDVVEIGAGTGYWAWMLTQYGVNVTAYDPYPPGEDNNYVRGGPYHPILPAGIEAAAKHPDRALMLCWPSFGEPWATHTLAAYQGDALIWVGGDWDGCCADETFFELRNAEWDLVEASPHHVTYFEISCRLELYRRKGAPA